MITEREKVMVTSIRKTLALGYMAYNTVSGDVFESTLFCVRRLISSLAWY